MFLSEKNALKKAVRKLKNILGDNLVSIIAFGSRIRGDYSEESDFDILIVVKRRTFDIIDMTNDVFGKVERITGVPFSVVVKGENIFDKEKKYNTSFYRNIVREGIVLHGSS